MAGDNKTYMATYDPLGEPDSMWNDSMTPVSSSHRLLHVGCTFQWIEDSVFWVCGWHEDNGDTWSTLYRYFVNGDTWGTQITPYQLVLGAGASIAYVPNSNYETQIYPVPGWIYVQCGGGTVIWRYALPTTLPSVALDGIYPGQGAIIADLTPPFEWVSSATMQYRIQVSADSTFATTVIDEVVVSPEYEPTTELENDTYYWRTAAWAGGAWSWGVSSHTFHLQGGWWPLAHIPEDVTAGGIIAYDEGSFGTGSKSILCLPGGAANENHQLHAYRYIIAEDTWVQLDSLAVDGSVSEGDGTSLTTSAPIEGASPLILVALRGQDADAPPYTYTATGWEPAENESGLDSLDTHFAENVGPYNSMVIGAGKRVYQVFDDEDFYFLHYPQEAGGGGQGHDMQTGAATTRAIAGYDGVEVEYELSVSARVRATLHDAVGRQVGSLDAGEQMAGIHRLRWDRDEEGRSLSAGTYFVLLDMGTERSRLKAVVK